jgi:hypothetical protein
VIGATGDVESEISVAGKGVRSNESAIVRGLAAAFTVLLAPVPSPSPSPARGVSSAHCTSTVAAEEARPGQAVEEAEIWLAGARMRIEARGEASRKTVVLGTETGVYVWVEGQSAGLRMSAAQAARSGRLLHGWLGRIEEIRSRGKKVGVERVGGFDCDVYQYQSPQDGRGTYWLAAKLQGFPLKAVRERDLYLPYRSTPIETTKLEYRYADVRIPARFPESLLAVPAGVKFQDASEILLKGRRPPPR